MACALETEQGILMNTNVSRKYSVVLLRLTYMPCQCAALPFLNNVSFVFNATQLGCTHSKESEEI